MSNDKLEAVASSGMQAELEQLRAQHDELVRAREQRARDAELAAKHAAAKLALRNEQAIEAAEREHGALDKKIRVVESELGVIIVKRAHPAVFKRFMDRGKHQMKDLEELLRHCLVHPTLTEFEAMCDEQVLLINRTTDAVAWLAGMRQEDVSTKP